MLGENLKMLRKKKGLSQEELAIRLKVVRQTISKWEKGLSVPDSTMLIKIADTFRVSVSELLGSTLDSETNINILSEQLSRLNEQLAIKNRRFGRIWKIIRDILIIIVVFNIMLVLLAIVVCNSLETTSTTTVISDQEVIVQEK